MSIYLRPVKVQDMDLLFKWANQDSVRKNSFNSQKIQYKDHKAWFSKSISDSKVAMYVLEDSGIPVAQVRLVIDNDQKSAIINYSVSEENQGKGYGKKVISMIDSIPEIGGQHIKSLIAKVKNSNVASMSIFKSNGYKEISVNDDVLIFQKEL